MEEIALKTQIIHSKDVIPVVRCLKCIHRDLDCPIINGRVYCTLYDIWKPVSGYCDEGVCNED